MEYDKQVRIDLHIHSTASDGTLSPSEILNLAEKLNLGAIAITDHDTVDGSKDAIQRGIPDSVKFLTGVEISASCPPSFDFPGSFHILGYSIGLDDPTLNQALDILQHARKDRNPRIIKRLNDMGMDISLSDVVHESGDGQIGRPHIARLLLKKGFAKSMEEVFERYLGNGKPAYVDKYRMPCAHAIQTILDAGGLPVLAHPILLNIESDRLFEKLLGVLKEMGLKGLEVFYPEHSPERTAFYAKAAERYGLLLTGGTDFHGSLKPDIQMGYGQGDLFIPYALYDKIIHTSPLHSK